ncbi:MAG: hypothetical protein LBT08_10270 [Synergistaceae bacterium]|jgi:hypothetical protein|nr:hypothetical protein [Synergistaceae bacterium]
MQHIWSWHAVLFDSVERESVTTKVLDEAWSVTIHRPGLAWGYCIPLPGDAKSHIMWNAGVRVMSTTGQVSPGIALHDFTHGILLQINERNNIAELRYVNVNKKTIRKKSFRVAVFSFPCDINLSYNAITSMCAGFINTEKLFEMSLPYKGIPTLMEISAIEVVTTTPDGEFGGTVKYDSLNLSCE